MFFKTCSGRVSPYDDNTTCWTNKEYIRESENVRSCKRPSIVTPLSSYAITWSWAALDGPVKFVRPSKVPQHAILCDYLIRPATIHIFGATGYGQLKIKVSIFINDEYSVDDKKGLADILDDYSTVDII